jgi:hypothetical protein
MAVVGDAGPDVHFELGGAFAVFLIPRRYRKTSLTLPLSRMAQDFIRSNCMGPSSSGPSIVQRDSVMSLADPELIGIAGFLLKRIKLPVCH